MTKNLADSRNKAMGWLINEVRNRAANAVIGMRFDTTELGDVWMTICAYGTVRPCRPCRSPTPRDTPPTGMDRERADLYLQLTKPRRRRFPDIGDLEYFGRVAGAAVGDRQGHGLRSLVFGWRMAAGQRRGREAWRTAPHPFNHSH
jgi:hypothetical protein